MDLITQYSDIILKKIMMKIQKDKKSKERAELVKLEMAETGAGVRSSRHWKAATNIEFYYNEIQKGSIRCVSWIGKQIGARNFIKIVSNL